VSGKQTRIPVWYFLNLNNKPVSVPKENIFDTVHSFLQANTHEYSGKKCSVYIMYYYITILNTCVYNFIIAKTSCLVIFSLTRCFVQIKSELSTKKSYVFNYIWYWLRI